MRRVLKAAFVFGAIVTFFSTGICMAQDRTRTQDRTRLLDQSCLTTPRSTGAQLGQQAQKSSPQRINTQSRSQQRHGRK